jgi:hypothetical protein
MDSLPHHISCFLAVGTAALLVGGCGSAPSSDAAKPTGSPTAPTTSTAEPPRQQYLDTVNHLCDDLLPKVLRVTHGGSIDIPAQQYLDEWPAHHKVLAAFDASLAGVPVPAAAAHAAAAMGSYVRFADRLDATRLKAARQGEAAWRREVAAEADVESDPAIAARTAAGFTGSCDAR